MRECPAERVLRRTLRLFHLQISEVVKYPLLDVIPDPSKGCNPFIVTPIDLRRIAETMLEIALRSGQRRVDYIRPVPDQGRRAERTDHSRTAGANGDHQINVLISELLNALRSMTCDVYSYLSHDPNREWMNSGWARASTEYFISSTVEVPEQPFGHLGSGGIVRA